MSFSGAMEVHQQARVGDWLQEGGYAKQETASQAKPSEVEERRKGGIIAGGQNPEECGPSLELGVHCARARLPSLPRESCE